MQSSISSTTWREGDTITLNATSTNVLNYPITLWVINYTSSDLAKSGADLSGEGRVFAMDVATNSTTAIVTNTHSNVNTLTPIMIEAGAPSYVGQTMNMPLSELQQYNRTYEIGTTYNITYILGDVILTGIVTWLREWFNTKEEHDALLFTDSGWKSCTLSSGYTVYTSGNTLRVRKIGKTIELSGVFKNTNAVTPNSTVFATVPTGYRPSATQVKLCQGSSMNHWVLRVQPNGNMTWERYGTTANSQAAAGSWMPYCITYMVD